MSKQRPVSSTYSTASTDLSQDSHALSKVECHDSPDYLERPVGGSWLELFYDLFFAASLSSFSRTREISNKRDLIDLAMFFTILWWTWTSQTLFDVRFAKYLKSQSISKFFALSFMIGYGVFEGQFSLFDRTIEMPGMITSERHRQAPRNSVIAISAIYILSRLMLATQFYIISRRSKQNRRILVYKTILPLLGATFWLISFFFLDDKEDGFFLIRSVLWLIGIMVEVLGTYMIRLTQHAGFDETHLTDRLGALTLIILGEGVIKLVSVLRDIHTGVGHSYKSMLAMLSSILAFYAIRAQYFDNLGSSRLGKLKAYSWVYLHFPFHLALVLLLDGITSLLLFTNISSGIEELLDPATESGIMQELFCLNNNATSTLALGQLSVEYDSITTTMTINGNEITPSQYSYVFIQLFGHIFESYNVELSEAFKHFIEEIQPDHVEQREIQRAFMLLLQQFTTAAQFFLLAGAGILLFQIPLRLLVPDNTHWSRFLVMSIYGLTGISLIIFATLNLGSSLSFLLQNGYMISILSASLILVYLSEVALRIVFTHR